MLKINQKGFSLMEVSVSIAIITIGLVSIVSLFSSNIKAEIKNKNKLVAIYLANESIEIVRQQRDNNWFRGIDWRTGIPTGEAIIVPSNISEINREWDIKSIANENKKKVYLDTDDIYLQRNVGIPANWQETKFKRHLIIRENSGGGIAGCLGVTDCLEVISRISVNGIQLAEVTAYFYDGWY